MSLNIFPVKICFNVGEGLCYNQTKSPNHMPRFCLVRSLYLSLLLFTAPSLTLEDSYSLSHANDFTCYLFLYHMQTIFTCQLTFYHMPVDVTSSIRTFMYLRFPSLVLTVYLSHLRLSSLEESLEDSIVRNSVLELL